MISIKKKRFIIIFAILMLFINIYSFNVYANNNDNSLNDSYKQQFENSNAEDMIYKLPSETKEILSSMGVNADNIDSINNLSLSDIFRQITVMLSQESKLPFKAMTMILGVMLLCALCESFKISVCNNALLSVAGVISTLCTCGIVVTPIVSTVSRASQIIHNSSDFMLMFIPVMAGIMVAGGQGTAGASYYSVMMGTGQLVAQTSSNFIVPLLNTFLALSITSAISPKLNISSICDIITRVIKWVLCFTMSIFTSVMTVKNLIGNGADNVTGKSLKFAISSFVPIVGSSLGDAFSTVQSSVKLLKSGIGVFAVIAIGFIYLPIIIECLIWQISIGISATAGDIFELKSLSNLLRATGKVISTLLAIILCCMTVFIISTVIILITGGSIS